MNTTEIKRALEAALLCTPDPLSMTQLRKLFDDEYNAELLRPLLDEIALDWAEHPVELVSVASGWRFQSRPEYAVFINRLTPEKAPRYSRAVMETLAIIAYRQPATRGDIEEIRGVSVSSQIIKTLEERGWIDVIGHKEVPGRPALFGTTRQFLDDMGLRSVKELPPIDEMGDGEVIDFFNQQVTESSPGEPESGEVQAPEGDEVAATDVVVSNETSGDAARDENALKNPAAGDDNLQAMPAGEGQALTGDKPADAGSLSAADDEDRPAVSGEIKADGAGETVSAGQPDELAMADESDGEHAETRFGQASGLVVVAGAGLGSDDVDSDSGDSTHGDGRVDAMSAADTERQGTAETETEPGDAIGVGAQAESEAVDSVRNEQDIEALIAFELNPAIADDEPVIASELARTIREDDADFGALRNEPDGGMPDHGSKSEAEAEAASGSVDEEDPEMARQVGFDVIQDALADAVLLPGDEPAASGESLTPEAPHLDTDSDEAGDAAAGSTANNDTEPDNEPEKLENSMESK